ncbi:C45 family peptidase [Halomonas sp. DP5Y7-2]|uniref:C45 family autoproteolytic acyltransferase/hydolase n=1 Tax=Halomonas sp. DP5Y7-2 TaxID=2859076 RepID=UPI001C99929A|nr:C45 family peptidase [Halomonas sp. DP5Y7-2]MBY5983227.1 C45 family peptidase [Halomonas sp. DP5Y7-2]
MQLTRLSGSRLEIGREHGRQHREAILASIDVYDRLFHDLAGLRWHEARRDAERFMPMIESRFPAILEEMDGIAQGIGGELTDVLTLNCRSEISLTRASGGCSAFSLARGGHQWLAQNWDWRADQLDHLVVLDVQAPGVPAFISIGEAGMVAKIGLNTQGIGVGLNAIRSATCGEGLPIHLALRKMLESEDFDNALAVAQDGVCAPAHLLLADGDGRALGLEVHPGPPGQLSPRRGVITHTNHLVSDAATHWVEDFPKPDSWSRLTRLDQQIDHLVAAQPSADDDAPGLDPDRLFDLLGDHSPGEESLCRHFDPSVPEAERMETLFSVVMDLTDKVLWLRHGKPCQPLASMQLAPRSH